MYIDSTYYSFLWMKWTRQNMGALSDTSGRKMFCICCKPCQTFHQTFCSYIQTSHAMCCFCVFSHWYPLSHLSTNCHLGFHVLWEVWRQERPAEGWFCRHLKSCDHPYQPITVCHFHEQRCSIEFSIYMYLSVYLHLNVFYHSNWHSVYIPLTFWNDILPKLIHLVLNFWFRECHSNVFIDSI